MNGLPTYSGAFVARRHTPLVAATVKPVPAMGTVGVVMEASEMFRQTPSNRRSMTRTEPKSDATPKMWTRLTTPYVHTPDSRMAWPSVEPCSHAMNSYKKDSRGYYLRSG